MSMSNYSTKENAEVDSKQKMKVKYKMNQRIVKV